MKRPPSEIVLNRHVKEWNRLYPIGTTVEFHPVIGEARHRVRKTLSEAWVLSGHTAVVRLENESGCVALEACIVTLPPQDGE